MRDVYLSWLIVVLFGHITPLIEATCTEEDRQIYDYNYRSYRIEYLRSCVNDSINVLTGNVYSLKITNTYIPILNQHCDLTNLYILELINCSINKISIHFFQSSNALDTLNLSENNLSTVDGLFYKLSTLKILNLSHNFIEEVNDLTFIGPIKLITLDLSKNRIMYLTDSIFHSHSTLSEIYLNDNALTEFSSQWFYNDHLQILNISSNQLKWDNFTKPIIRLNIDSLYMSNTSLDNKNLIRILELAEPESLVILDLSSNGISKLPLDIFKDMVNLEVLNIQNNLLDSVEYGSSNNWFNLFFIMKKLKTVDINDNLWNCDELHDIINILIRAQISIIPGNNYNETNLLGMVCTEKSEHHYGDFKLESNTQLTQIIKLISDLNSTITNINQTTSQKFNEIHNKINKINLYDTNYTQRKTVNDNLDKQDIIRYKQIIKLIEQLNLTISILNETTSKKIIHIYDERYNKSTMYDTNLIEHKSINENLYDKELKKMLVDLNKTISMILNINSAFNITNGVQRDKNTNLEKIRDDVKDINVDLTDIKHILNYNLNNSNRIKSNLEKVKTEYNGSKLSETLIIILLLLILCVLACSFIIQYRKKLASRTAEEITLT